MTQTELQTYHEYAFDAFCKKVIKHAAADAHRERRKQKRMELDIDQTMIAYIHSIQTQDTYSPYTRTYYVKDLPIVVKDKQLGDALQFIVPCKRAVLLLSYFSGYNDSEIAQLLGISSTSVARRKRSGLIRLRELMEVRYHGK